MPPLNPSDSPRPEAKPLDIAAIRARLAGSRGREYWRSLEELSETEEFKDFLKHEFPRDVDTWMDPTSRRGFLKLMGASLALAFCSGCENPIQYIVPYDKAPEDVVPGKPLYYASALPFQGYARGVLVKSTMGRPTKIEGNPQHPDSLGSSDYFMQAAALTFYDPDRSQNVTYKGHIRTWDDFQKDLDAVAEGQKASKGAGLRILTETVTSPTLAAQLKEIQARYPEAQWHEYEPSRGDGARAGAVLAFGKPVETRLRLDRADVIVSLDSDFFVYTPGGLRYARDFADKRDAGGPSMNRLYVVETDLSITGTMADHRLPLTYTQVEGFARLLASKLGVAGVGAPAAAADQSQQAWLAALVKDLKKHAGTSLIIAGAHQPAVVHALAHAMNALLGNAGRTVEYSDPVDAKPEDPIDSLRRLVADMEAGKVEALLILGGNPVYAAPADLDLAAALDRVPWTAHLSLYDDETSAACGWNLPEAHPLEAWGDLRAFDGTVTVQQPQILPLYGGKSACEILGAFLAGAPAVGLDVVQAHWKGQARRADFDGFWRKTLNDGVVADTALPARTLKVKTGFAAAAQEAVPSPSLELAFKPDPTMWDGQNANNGWLQELAKPATKLTWDNAALMSPALAERLGVSNDDVVELDFEGRRLEAPVLMVPGHADRAVTVTLGYGRSRSGRVGTGVGYNAYALRTTKSPWGGAGLSINKTGRRHKLVTTQHHFSMEDRDLVRVATWDEFHANPTFAKKEEDTPAPQDSLYNYSKSPASPDYAWGMGIDLNRCIGCNACMSACQAENNIPVVGKDQVAVGREMTWIRVDRYFTGDLDNPASYNQPVPCMHCEDAPCEVVCPVGATNHSEEGLNQMVYNRCVGTRYCSNNCPYKVRRFNFFNFSKAFVKGTIELVENPDVTVRTRGVMEKCTYCIQRIQGAKITSEEEGRLVRDGEITPACAQACPTRAIVFGNLKDPDSAVNKRKADPRDYPILGSLGTRPRTTYQARLRNPNPELEAVLQG